MDDLGDNESSIERRHRIGQTSEQLADRNSVWRVLFYGVVGGVSFGMAGNFILPAFVIGAVFLGIGSGVALAICIEEKIKRSDVVKESKRHADLAKERAQETMAKIEAAKANGDFDRWNKDE